MKLELIEEDEYNCITSLLERLHNLNPARWLFSDDESFVDMEHQVIIELVDEDGLVFYPDNWLIDVIDDYPAIECVIRMKDESFSTAIVRTLVQYLEGEDSDIKL